MSKSPLISLTIAYRSSKYLLSMINDILDYHQISNGKLSLNYEYFSLWGLIQDVSKLIKFQAKLKGLKFIKENKVLERNEKAFIRSDPNRIKQVILNLLGNALKFTVSGSITISLEEAEEGDGEGQTFLIKVTDTGLGIKNEDQPKLFKLFGKLDSSSKEMNKNGIGLGLAISQDLVRKLNLSRNNAEIKVNSQYGKGSCFYFPLRSVIEANNEENFSSQISEPKVNEVYRKIKMKIFQDEEIEEKDIVMELLPRNIKLLLVDDDQINILVARSYLNAMPGVTYEIANNGLQALQKISQNAENGNYYDIILMDCFMPVMNGLEATTILREQIRTKCLPETFIIACTAKASESDYDACLQVGMNDYLTKPFSKKDLILKLKKYSEGKMNFGD